MTRGLLVLVALLLVAAPARAQTPWAGVTPPVFVVTQSAVNGDGQMSVPLKGFPSIQGANGSQIIDVLNGIWRLADSAGTGFTGLIFGSNDVNGVRLKKSGTVLSLRLGGDTADADFTANDIYPNAAAITPGSGTGVTVNSTGTARRLIYKVTVDRTQFIAAAVNADITIATLPAKTALLAVYADLTTTFACTATCTTSTLSMTLGSAAGGNTLLVSFDADAATLTRGLADADLGTDLTRATAVQGGKIYSFSATQIITARLISGTGNIGTGAATNLSQGSITFYLVTERLP